MAQEPIDASSEAAGDGAPAGAWQRRLASIAALIAAVLLIALVVLVAMSGADRDKALLRERHSYEVMLVTRQLDASIARAEAALGRFVIGGETPTGALYYDGWKRAGRQLDRLATLTRDNPAQAPLVRDLQRLYRARGRELAAPATRTFAREGWAALSMYYDAGKTGSIARIDMLMARIAANERDLLDARADRAALSVDRANYLTAVLSGIGLLLVLCAAALGWTTVQALAQRARARIDARTESARARALEQAVTARTHELREANDRLRDEAETREAAEAQLRQVQKMEAVGQLTGGIAHDFNNMLAVVVGGLDLARRRLEHEAGEVGRHIDNAMEGATRAAALTRRLLAFARAEPLLPEGVEPGALIAGMSDLIDRTLGERIAVTTGAAPDGWHVWCDPHQLENAILNLAVNARDAMHEEGRLTITTGNVTLREGDIGQARAGDYVRVAVADTGTGMTPEVLARVFEPFFTTKPPGKGTGLGLSQTFGFARQSEGEVAIDSTPGAGTTVSLYLPRFVRPAQEEQAGTVTPIVPVARGAAGAVVLVVEDDPRVRQATVGGLRELGYAPLPCASGAEAIALLDSRDDIALIVTDVVMPEMTGPELIAAIAGRHDAIPVLYVTGYVGEAADATGFAGHDVLRKPFTVAALDRAVASALAGRRAAPRPLAANE